MFPIKKHLNYNYMYTCNWQRLQSIATVTLVHVHVQVTNKIHQQNIIILQCIINIEIHVHVHV